MEFKGPFTPIYKDPMDWPITRFYRNRKGVVEELAELSFRTIKEKYGERLPDVIQQTIYSERIRAKNEAFKVDPPAEYEYWTKLGKELNEISLSSENEESRYDELCKKILRRYAEEISADFNPKTFAFIRKLLTRLFGAVYNPWYKKDQNGLWWGKTDEIIKKFKVTGPIEKIRNLFERTSVVLIPTHFSNLDGPLIGYGIEMMTGMPPFSYGAGLNLYDYELAAYFMSRLGAYTIDRRKRNVLYLNTLKQFSTLSILKGLNNIFYPGGTRSRSGEIEKNVKYGLLGTLIEAQNYNYSKGIDKKVMVLPLVLSYHFVLEADSLIDNHLRKTGKEKYVPTKTERKNSKTHFLRRFLKSDSEVYMAFGEPRDVFGNALDEHANSIHNGEKIDIKQHFITDKEISFDKQRNDVYTRILAEKIVESYHKESVVLSSHLIAFCAFEMFKASFPNMDIFSLLSLPLEVFTIDKGDFFESVNKMIHTLKRLNEEGRVQLSPMILNSNEEILADGLKNLNSFHANQPLYISDKILKSMNLKLLFYYHNRLTGYKLENSLAQNVAKPAQKMTTIY